MTSTPLKSQFLLLSLVLFLLTAYISCFDNERKNEQANHKKTILSKEAQTTTKNFKGKHVPVLCYHAIRDINKNDSANQKTYSVSPASFSSQIKALADNGYTSITPDELKDFYTKHHPLPEKPILITFDDGRKEQYSIGARILERHHFKGVFFIMTVTLDKKHYMNQSEIKALSDRGHIIGCHTWDHNKVTEYDKKDWQIQLAKPKTLLENITHRPVTCFAYPYGVWNFATADSVKNYGFTTAFIVFGKADSTLPLYTLQRIVVKNSGTSKYFLIIIEKSVNDN
ncbi:polysaccharide deacetylase family protein [Flavobacterium paronense]|uniref:Polysaccharide deacetylase family protein n=1 Tax=Flavobacterium paronense TaxID=1392775 RepID=A0ABV5GC41_9FLAO|nr:polysaccharide deacetylase family protein [Flavobacterium paronense]MDN3677800.1 polysaccharide deacetylase family protein [Flavobacterium paronense]